MTGQKVGPLADPTTGKLVNFLNSFGATGLYFQTGAWERNNSKNVGIFWTALRYIACYANPSQLKEFLPTIAGKSEINIGNRHFISTIF